MHRHPYVRTVQVCNSGLVPAAIRALAPDAGAAAECAVAVEPAAFTVPAQGRVGLRITLTGARLGRQERVLRFLVRLCLALRRVAGLLRDYSAFSCMHTSP